MTPPVIRTLLTTTCFLLVTCQQSDPKLTPQPSNSSLVQTEGGPVTVNKTDTHTKTKPPQSHFISVNTTHQNQNKTELPAIETPEKNDGKQSVGRKGVTVPVNITTTKEKPKKPLLTEAEEDTVYVPSVKQTNKTDNHGNSIESLIEKGKKTDYVVPIVVVILSVPLVAIIFSVLYKRGAEWWQHRHYRRMDFLIEGMYNN